MKFTVIQDWNKKNLHCHFCGTDKDVKYKTNETEICGEEKEVYVCSSCLSKVSNIIKY